MPGRDKRGAKQGQKGWDFKQEKEIEETRLKERQRKDEEKDRRNKENQLKRSIAREKEDEETRKRSRLVGEERSAEGGGERRVERGVERVARVAPFEEPPSVMENGAYCLKNKADWRNKTEGLEDVEARRRLSLEGNARWLGAGEVERVNQRIFGVISFDLAKSPVLDGMTWSAVDMRIAKIV